MEPEKLYMEEVNGLFFDDFIDRFQNVVEHGRLMAGAAYSYRPFSSLDHLHQSFCDVMDSLPTPGKQAILRCHPNLAGRLAQQGKLTSESEKEQASAGLSLSTLSEAQFKDINSHNEIYRDKFLFPFVICARENKVEAIIEGLQRRIQNSEEEELVTGVGEVKKISYYRLLDLVHGGSRASSKPKL